MMHIQEFSVYVSGLMMSGVYENENPFSKQTKTTKNEKQNCCIC